jgi:hypothetical protein
VAPARRPGPRRAAAVVAASTTSLSRLPLSWAAVPSSTTAGAQAADRPER